MVEWTVTETEHEQKYSLCGAIATEKGEHTFGDWTITREAAPGEEGEQERVCELCEYTETEATPALEIEESPAPAPTAEPIAMSRYLTPRDITGRLSSRFLIKSM